jgi:peptide/nickel transport system permease protein
LILKSDWDDARLLKIERLPRALSTFRSKFSLLFRNIESIIGLIIVAVYLAVGLAAAIADSLSLQITPYDPLQQNVGTSLGAPSSSHLFGLDFLGRDVFSRVVVSIPNALIASFCVVGVAICVGALVGSVAAFKGGLFDELLMRFTDVIFALPALVIAMVIAVVLGPGLTHMMIALMVIWWPPYARVARGEALKVSHQNYIEAAKFAGQRTGSIILRHVLPNISITLLVYATLDVATVVLTYAGLSYLGLSVRPPQPDLGEMISTTQDYLILAPWLPVIPGVVIALLVVGFCLLGDGIRDALEAA